MAVPDTLTIRPGSYDISYLLHDFIYLRRFVRNCSVFGSHLSGSYDAFSISGVFSLSGVIESLPFQSLFGPLLT